MLYSVRKSFFFSFIHSFLYISMNSWLLNLFSRQYLFLLLFTDPQIVPDLPSPFRLAFSSFDIFSSFFEHFCTLWHTHKNFPGLSYTFPTPALESSISSKSFGLFFVLFVCLFFFCYFFAENGI